MKVTSFLKSMVMATIVAIPAISLAADPTPKPTAPKQATNSAPTQFVNHRVDNDLVAGFGTCQIDDFRFFTMLHQEAWDFLCWETLGNAVMEHRTWRDWPYEQRLHVQVDGKDVSSDAQVVQVEQQFDFRQVIVSGPSVKIERLDMMLSARQWATALRLTNQKNSLAKIVVEVEWTTRRKIPLDVRSWSDGDYKGFAYSIKNGPPTLVALGHPGTWKKN